MVCACGCMLLASSLQYSASEASLNQRWVAQLASSRKAREMNAQGSGSQQEEELVQLLASLLPVGLSTHATYLKEHGLQQIMS